MRPCALCFTRSTDAHLTPGISCHIALRVLTLFPGANLATACKAEEDENADEFEGASEHYHQCPPSCQMSEGTDLDHFRGVNPCD